MRRTTRTAATIGAVALITVAAGCEQPSPYVSDLVNVNLAGTAPSADWAGPAVISPDGTKVYFVSSSTDMTADVDNNGGQDIYVRDLEAGTTTLLTHSFVPGDTPLGSSGDVQLSPDGTRLAFSSSARDLVRGDANGRTDVFLLDLASGAYSLVSKNAAGTASANGTSDSARFSPDGNRLVFTSSATNLVAGVADGVESRDVFVRDLATGTTTLVSENLAGDAAGSTDASGPFAPDGTKVAFTSYAGDLTTDDTNDAVDVFVRDLVAGTTTLVSVNSDGNDGGLTDSREPSFNADGTKVAFTSGARDLLPGDTNGVTDVFLRDLVAGTTTLVSHTTGGGFGPGYSNTPRFSPDGATLAFVSISGALVTGDFNTSEDIFLHDVATGTNSLATVNVDGDGPGSNGSNDPVWSADSQLLFFESAAKDLGGIDKNGTSDIYVRDLERGLTRLVSAGPDGEAGELWGHFFTVSADSRRVAYFARSDDLVPIDTNDREDLYVATLHGVDLGVTITDDPDPVGSGDDLSYEVVVTNGGPDSGDAELTITLPAGVDFVAAAGATCTPPSGTPQVVECTVSGLGEGDETEVTVDVEVTAAAGATLKATAQVGPTGDDVELDNRDNGAEATTAVVP